MQLELNFHNGTLDVKVFGELDMAMAEEFRNKVDEAIVQLEAKNLILNLAGVTFIDSSGLGAILGRYKKITELGGKVAIVQPGPTVSRLLELSGILRIINTFSDNSQAMHNF